jgi:hypothetical protein
MAKPTKHQRKRQLPKVVKYLRGTSVACTLIGGVGMMQPDLFALGAGSVYLGLFLLAIDVFYEPDFRWRGKVFGIALLAVVALLFTKYFLLTPAPLNVSAVATVAEFPADTKIAGIEWRPEYTELVVVISNPTEGAYDDVTLLIEPDHPVAAAAQETSVPGVWLQDRYARSMNIRVDQRAVNFKIIASNVGYNAHIDKLPAHGTVKVVFALANMSPGTVDKTKQIQWYEMLDPEIVYRESMGGKITYWHAHPAKKNTFGEKRPEPKTVRVSGHYVGRLRERPIAIDVGIPR